MTSENKAFTVSIIRQLRTHTNMESADELRCIGKYGDSDKKKKRERMKRNRYECMNDGSLRSNTNKKKRCPTLKSKINVHKLN